MGEMSVECLDQKPNRSRDIRGERGEGRARRAALEEELGLGC